MDTKDLALGKSDKEEHSRSLSRIAEQVTINVISFIVIGILGILVGFVYSVILLVQNWLRAPSDISAVVVLGAMIIFIVVSIVVSIKMSIASIERVFAAGLKEGNRMSKGETHV